MKQSPIKPSAFTASTTTPAAQHPVQEMLTRTLGADAASLPASTLDRIAQLLDDAENRRHPRKDASRPSRLMHHLAEMRRADSPGGGCWSDIEVLMPGKAVIIGELDRRVTGLHAVLCLLHAAERGRAHDDGVSELGEDLNIGLLFAARELTNGARESLSDLHEMWMSQQEAADLDMQAF